TPDDVSLFIPHQANLRIIEAAAKRVNLPMDRVFVNVDRYGNTGAASVYVALEEAIAAGRLKRGDLVLLVAFVGGFAWGAALMRWSPPPDDHRVPLPRPGLASGRDGQGLLRHGARRQGGFRGGQRRAGLRPHPPRVQRSRGRAGVDREHPARGADGVG